MAGIVVYEKPTCSKCRELVRLLRERGIEHERIDFHAAPLSAAQVRELVDKTGLSARDLLRDREPAFRELGLGAREVGDEEAIRLIAEHPALLQRPIAVRGERAVLARPAERALELLDPRAT